ncbi:GEVED domain-containing protein [Chitinophagaceae bacterium MMS25-I14]
MKRIYSCAPLCALIAMSATAAYGQTQNFGDAPSPYPSAQHTVNSQIRLGATVTASNSAYAYPATDPSDDAFGVDYLPPLYVGATSYTISSIPVHNKLNSAATLYAWIDFNHDGDFNDAGEATSVSVPKNTNTVNLTWNMSSLQYVGATWARFRITSDAAVTTSTPGGSASNGEVEDYYMWVSDNKNCGAFESSYILSNGTLGYSDITTNGSYTEFYSGGHGQNELASNNDNNLYYYGSGDKFYWYDPITNTEGTLVSSVSGLGTQSFGSADPLSESAGYYFNGRFYFTLDNLNSNTYYYSVDLDVTGKSVVSGSLRSYGSIGSADHGDFVVIDNNGAPEIYDITSNNNTVTLRKIYDLESLVGTTGAISASNNILTYSFSGTGLSNIAQMAYDASTSTFYVNQGTSLYKITLSGTATATLALVRNNAFSSEPYDMGNNICVSNEGDLPNTYKTLLGSAGAQHGLFNSPVKLGSVAYAQEDGIPSVNADGTNDDDGAPQFPSFAASNYTVKIKVTTTSAITSSNKAYLTAWIDFNGDGDFNDAGEKSVTTQISTGGLNNSLQNVVFSSPSLTGSLIGKYARFRISTDNSAVQTPGGYAKDGEVEDYLITNIGTPLEVTMMSFSAEAKNNATELSWVTSSEKNSSYFDVERSTDGRTFSKIGSVDAQGTTELTHEYNYEDNSPASGINYYRLKSVDMDGSFRYTDVRTVRFGGLTSGNARIVPNPSSGNANVVLPAPLSGNAAIMVYNSVGTVIYKASASGQQVINLDLSSFASGLYHVLVMDGENVLYREKMIKQ